MEYNQAMFTAKSWSLAASALLGAALLAGTGCQSRKTQEAAIAEAVQAAEEKAKEDSEVARKKAEKDQQDAVTLAVKQAEEKARKDLEDAVDAERSKGKTTLNTALKEAKLEQDAAVEEAIKQTKTNARKDLKNAVAPAKGHEGDVVTLMFGDNGKRLLSAGADRTIIAWDTGTGDLVWKRNVEADIGLLVGFQAPKGDPRLFVLSPAKQQIAILESATGKAVE